jgi:hypothetical protein
VVMQSSCQMQKDWLIPGAYALNAQSASATNKIFAGCLVFLAHRGSTLIEPSMAAEPKLAEESPGSVPNSVRF